MYEFSFSGGKTNVSPHETEQFYLFFLVNGREVSFYSLRKQGIIQKGESERSYLSPYPFCKVFMYHAGFSRQKRMYSIYLELLPYPATKITLDTLVSTETFYFKARAHFLKKSEILQLLDKKENSYKFVEKQGPLPLAFIQTYIKVDRSEVKKVVRRIRV